MASDKALYEAYQAGKSFPEIAAEYGFRLESVRGRVYRHAKRIAARQVDMPPFPVFLRGRTLALDIPRLTDFPRLQGDALVVGDLHVPCTDWTLVELLARFGEKHLPRGKRRLFIVGDLLNFDALSKYDHIASPINMAHELAAAEATLDHLGKVFDEMVFTLGNHDHRLFKRVEGALTETQFGQLISNGMGDKLRVSGFGHAEVTGGGQRWRLTHPANYSKTKGAVAATLAQKFQCNIASFHEHHVAMLRDPYNRYTLINGGGMFDPEKLAYVSLMDSTSSVMCNGFVFLRNGVGHLLTPYPSMTDWDMWRMDAAALPAIAAAQGRMERLSGVA